MQLNTQFAAVLYGFREKSIAIKLPGRRVIYLPNIYVIAYQPMGAMPPLRLVWLTVDNWIARQEDIEDARPRGER